MSKKIKSNGKQVFNIPLDEEGKKVLKYLRKHAQKGTRIRARGRGSRKHHGNHQDISREHADWAAVYIDRVSEPLQDVIDAHSRNHPTFNSIEVNPALSTREWTCENGHLLDRDVNAAMNVLNEGLKIINEDKKEQLEAQLEIITNEAIKLKKENDKLKDKLKNK